MCPVRACVCACACAGTWCSRASSSFASCVLPLPRRINLASSMVCNYIAHLESTCRASNARAADCDAWMGVSVLVLLLVLLLLVRAGEPLDSERLRYFATVSKVFLMSAVGGFFDDSKATLNSFISSAANQVIFTLDVLAVRIPPPPPAAPPAAVLLLLSDC